MTKYNPSVFTVFRNEKETDSGETKVTLSMRPKLGKYGVKSITVELNDGELVELDGDSVFFMNDPRERIEYQVNNKKIDEDEGQRRLSALDNACISKEVVLKVN